MFTQKSLGIFTPFSLDYRWHSSTFSHILYWVVFLMEVALSICHSLGQIGDRLSLCGGKTENIFN